MYLTENNNQNISIKNRFECEAKLNEIRGIFLDCSISEINMNVDSRLASKLCSAQEEGRPHPQRPGEER